MATPHRHDVATTGSGDLPPTGWGSPASRTGLPAASRAWLIRQVGRGAPAPVLAAPALPPSRLGSEAAAALVAVVGPKAVDASDAARRIRSAGRSYLDLLALRAGTADAPDAVVLPGSPAEVGDVLRVCAAHGLAVVPFGGGTSVVGGVRPLRGNFGVVVAVDLRRLDQLVQLDATSRVVELQAGLRGPAAEALLAGHGLTLGHFPQSFEHATIGGFAATRSSGQASAGYGRFDANVIGLHLETPAGPLELGRGTASAAGPALLQLGLGSEGTFGIITSVRLQVRPAPTVRRYDAVLVRSFADGQRMLRELVQSGRSPDVARLSDPVETTVGLRSGAPRAVQQLARGRCLLITGWEGDADSVRRRRRAARGVVRGLPLPGGGTAWEHGRYAAPYLRDDLLDEGFLVETLETGATWSELAATWASVRAAITSAIEPAVMMCHISHLYPQGASLYVTVLAARSGSDPVGQWQRVKDAASAAIIGCGATITHHHAVGTDHRPWMTEEVGPLGVEVLRAVKTVLDPTGILNPGKLIPSKE